MSNYYLREDCFYKCTYLNMLPGKHVAFLLQKLYFFVVFCLENKQTLHHSVKTHKICSPLCTFINDCIALGCEAFQMNSFHWDLICCGNALFTRQTFRSIYYLKVPYWKHKLLCQCPFTVIGYSELWLQRQRENNITTCLVIPDQYKYMFIHPVQYCNSALFIIDQFDWAWF